MIFVILVFTYVLDNLDYNLLSIVSYDLFHGTALSINKACESRCCQRNMIRIIYQCSTNVAPR